MIPDEPEVSFEELSQVLATAERAMATCDEPLYIVNPGTWSAEEFSAFLNTFDN